MKRYRPALTVEEADRRARRAALILLALLVLLGPWLIADVPGVP